MKFFILPTSLFARRLRGSTSFMHGWASKTGCFSCSFSHVLFSGPLSSFWFICDGTLSSPPFFLNFFQNWRFCFLLCLPCCPGLSSSAFHIPFILLEERKEVHRNDNLTTHTVTNHLTGRMRPSWNLSEAFEVDEFYLLTKAEGEASSLITYHVKWVFSFQITKSINIHCT